MPAKKLVLFSYFLIILLQSQPNVVQADRSAIGTLKFVHALWRHGDRTPSQETFPSDIGNRAETWPQGLGELTMLGVRQQYELGRYLRQRYDGFLSRKYLPYEIAVRSTSYNRAIMSASANMAGLFEPEGDQIWNQGLRWQPVPVQVVPKEDDPLLYTYRSCPVAEQLFDDYIQNSPELRRLEQQYARLLKFLAEKSGLNRTLRLYDDVYEIYDPLLCELVHNDTHIWPSWMNMTIFLELEELYAKVVCNIYPTFDLQRLRGGLLLGDMLSRMKNQTTNNGNKKQKFFGYSAHDTTLTAFFNNLGAPQPRSPPFAALLMVELHQRNNNYFVEMYYKNDTNRDAYPVEVGECPRPCSLAQFSVRSEPRIPKDWLKECGIEKCDDKKWQLATPPSFIDALSAVLKRIATYVSPSRQ